MELPRRQSGGWVSARIVFVCFLAQNCASGLAFGSYGALLANSESHFGISRALAATGVSVLMLAMGLLAPFAGTWVQRVPVRAAMLVGAVASTAAYWILAITDSYAVALAMYGLMGAGVILLSLIGPVTIISRWFPNNRAKMLGLVNLPLFLFLAPYLVAEGLLAFGRFGVLASIGTFFIALIPLLMTLVERPSSAQQVASEGTTPAVAVQVEPMIPGLILKSPAFWLLSLVIGVMSGSGSAYVVHFIAFATSGKDMSLPFASIALSAYSGAGFFGILLFSWLADRIGAIITLTLIAFLQAAAWFAFLHIDSPTMLLIMSGMLGMCVNAVVTLHGAILGDLFGTEHAGKAMGYSYMAKLPFIFTFAPAFGTLYDHLGDYTIAFFSTSLMLAAAGVLGYVLWSMVRRTALLTPAAA